MALPTDINERVRTALKAGYAPEAIQADIKRKYGADVSVKPLSGLDRAANASNKLLSTLAGLTGIDKGGESLARLSLQLGHQMGKVGGLDTNRTLMAPKATGKQVAGDVLRVGGTALNLAAAPASTSKRILANTLTGASLGAGNTLTEGGSAGEAVQSGVGRGALAGGTTAALAGLGTLFSKLTKDVPVATYKTSTRIPNKTDAELLIKEGITGGRGDLRSKSQTLLNETGKHIRQALGRRSDTISGEDVFQYEPLQRIRTQAQRLGEAEGVDRAIFKVMPKPSGQIAEDIPDTLAPLRDQIDELTAKGSADDTVAALERQYVTRANKVPLVEALEQRQAIDTATPPSVFTDRSTAMGSRAEGAVADALRRALGQKAPEITPDLNKEAAALALMKELKAYENAKASPVSYGLGNLAQRTLLHPALATRAAGAAYSFGVPFNLAQSSPLTSLIKRAFERAGVAAIGNR